jgi:hypothetical protein
MQWFAPLKEISHTWCGRLSSKSTKGRLLLLLLSIILLAEATETSERHLYRRCASRRESLDVVEVARSSSKGE